MAENQAISLYDLNCMIGATLSGGLPDMLWVRAETSDVRANQNGHCYLEFIEKDSSGRSVVAKMRAMIWANTFHLLKAYFESSTGQPFASGLKVMVQVSVSFHEVFGLSLVVHDIDPAYTLGDQALNRAAILRQLEEDGVLTLNKELELPIPTNRIAIISSPTAAGYEDFCDQLERNSQGLKFYTKLFPAIMQGDRAEDSIIAALEKIYDNMDCFDAVVIIRGGGATSELSSFDSYLLAASCAQFPLPIITGIGHERDETVLDIVAHTRAKTPTAVAEFLIAEMTSLADELEEIASILTSDIPSLIQNEMQMLNHLEKEFYYFGKSWYTQQSNILDMMTISLKKEILANVKDSNAKFASYSNTLKRAALDSKNESDRISLLTEQLKRNISNKLEQKDDKLENIAKFIELVSPQHIVKKGYSITMKDGKVVKSSKGLESGDELTSLFAEGEIKSIVKK